MLACLNRVGEWDKCIAVLSSLQLQLDTADHEVSECYIIPKCECMQ